MLSDNKVIEIFYMADDFCIFFNETYSQPIFNFPNIFFIIFSQIKIRFISKTFTSLHKVLNMKRINRESYTKRILDLLGKNEVIVLTGHRRAKDFLS